MSSWIDLLFAISTLLMVIAAILKVYTKSQPIGAFVVIVLGIVRGIAVLAGFETMAYATFNVMTGILTLLIIVDLRWKAERQRNKN